MVERSEPLTKSSPPQMLENVVAVHQAAFPGFFMTQLGPRFLREYYRCVIDTSTGVVLAEVDGGKCLGFVAGFVDPAAFYRELRRRRLRLGLTAIRGIALSPRRFMTFLENSGRARQAAQLPSGPEIAELSSLAIAPGVAGRGIGSRLVRAFIDAVATVGAGRVVLTTDARENDAVNRFYQRLGFVCTRTFEARRGRWLNEYQYSIRKS